MSRTLTQSSVLALRVTLACAIGIQADEPDDLRANLDRLP